MGNENGEWIMHGIPATDSRCLHTPEDVIALVNAVGYLPLFRVGPAGFSLEERTESRWWWSGDAEHDPWEWRAILARSGKVAYAKFFDNKAGFVSLAELPHFVNMRRDGYDFDALFDDGKASDRERKLMRLFADGGELYSFELKSGAGFGKNGESNFEGTVTALQMQTYLTVRDFRPRRNKHGEPYGWAVAVYTTPEAIWGYDAVTAAYGEPPEQSRRHVYEKVRENFSMNDKTIRKLLR